MAALTPGPKTPGLKGPKVQNPAPASNNQQPTNSKKQLAFKRAPSPKAALHNITNKSAAPEENKKGSFKPYKGKVQPWNAKETLQKRQQMANRELGGKNIKEKQMSVIKGVRLNKRTELMMQRRNLK